MHEAGGSVWRELHWRQPLYYLLLYLSTGLLGVNELGLRAVAALSGLLTLAVTYHLGVRLLNDRRAAFLASLTLMATFFFYLFARRVRGLDITLTLFIELAVLYGMGAFSRPRRWLGAGLFTGLAVLTKSVVGLLPVAVLGFALLARRRWDVLRSGWLYAGFAVAGAVSAVWPLLALTRANAGGIATHFKVQVAGRAARTIIGGQETPLHYYAGVLWEYEGLLGAAALVLVPACLILAARRRESNALVCAFWAGLVFVLFSLASTRLEHYLLPAYPAFALLLGWLVVRLSDGAAARWPAHARTLFWAPTALAASLLLTSWVQKNTPLLLQMDHSPEEKAIALQARDALPAGGSLYCLDLYWPAFELYSQRRVRVLTTSRAAYSNMCAVPTACKSGFVRFVGEALPEDLFRAGKRPVAVAVDTRITPPALLAQLGRRLRLTGRTEHLLLFSTPRPGAPEASR